MLEDGILETEQSVTRLSKWLRDLKHFTLALTKVKRRSKKTDPVNRLVMSGPRTNMIVPIVLFEWIV